MVSEKIASRIRKTISGLSIVSLTGRNGVTWGDVNIKKGYEVATLREAIKDAIPVNPPVRR